MSHLTALKAAVTLTDVAKLLNFKPAAVSYLLYKMPSALKYTAFDIPKRYGGTRRITAPCESLKLLQERLSDFLQNCVEEINVANELKDQISHGFKRKRSIVTNARRHRNRHYVFNLDLSDFFGTINFGRVRGFFIKDKSFALKPKVATVLAQIACFNNGLPQGSPCSPVISNLVGHILDVHLVKLASRAGCTYSRYADDLTFSTNRCSFPKSVARQKTGTKHEWVPGRELARLLKHSGFAANPRKTRLQYRDSRQEVTGLIVNRKINVRREYRHTVRAMVHRLTTKGSFEIVYKRPGGNSAPPMNGTLNQLHGMLGFIHSIDLYNRRLVEEENHKRATDYTRAERVYRHFLLFKEFYVAPAPVILCEGPTDNVYLTHAIRSLVANHTKLATKDASGKITLGVRVYKYVDTRTGQILGMSGGSSHFGHFMNIYQAAVKKFAAPGQHHPVILVADNDSGATPIYNAVKKITGTKPTGTEPFVHVVANLYLVPIPKANTAIEGLFDPSVLQVAVAGKTFHPDGNGFDPSLHYGKKVLAHKVVRPNADTIDFTGFSGLLTSITEVIDAHAKLRPSP